MPRFFYHVHDGSDCIDQHGIDLIDLEAAQREAARFAGALLADEAERLWERDACTVRVTDADQATLFQLTFFATAAAQATR